jgi:quercetin dioxygenase-like cupin family protein
MLTKAGVQIVRVADIPWEDRMNVDNWPSRAGMYYDDRGNNLCLRLIDYPVGAIEPRHVHGGTHATTLLKGTAIIDGLTLGPLDVILGPGNEPHGPISYPEGCQLFSAFQGSFHHSEVEQLSGKQEYRLIEQAKLPWEPADNGRECKTLVDHGCGRLLLEALRFAPGAQVAAQAHPRMQAAVVVEGRVVIEDETLGTWDFMRLPASDEHGVISFPDGATLLVVTMR